MTKSDRLNKNKKNMQINIKKQINNCKSSMPRFMIQKKDLEKLIY